MKYWKYFLVVVVLSLLFTIGCNNEAKLVQQENLVYEGKVIAITPVVGGTINGPYIQGAVIYFQDGSNVKVDGDIDLILGGYYIITAIPPINEYWEYLEIESISYKP